MGPPVFAFRNNHKLAHAVAEALESLGGPSSLSLRPYNRFSPAFTTWWFVPVKDAWPAFHLAKLCFHPLNGSSDQSADILVGFQIEKGVTSKVEGLPEVNPSHIIRPYWQWNTLSDRAFRGQVLASAEQVLSISRQPLTVMLDAYAFNRVPQPDNPAAIPDDSAIWIAADKGFALTPKNPATGELLPLSSSSDLDALMTGLPLSSPLEYFWLDFRVGTVIQLSDHPQPTSGYEIAELWRATLEPWLPLLAWKAAFYEGAGVKGHKS